MPHLLLIPLILGMHKKLLSQGEVSFSQSWLHVFLPDGLCIPGWKSSQFILSEGKIASCIGLAGIKNSIQEYKAFQSYKKDYLV